jgi:hypothetical protein
MVRRPRWVPLFAALLSIGALDCGGRIQPTPRDPRFVGKWMLETGSGVFRSETWEFRADGTTEMLGRRGDQPILLARREFVGCGFGAWWDSIDSSHVAVGLQCTDNVARTGTIAFPVDPASDNLVTEIRVVSVDGASDWQLDGFTMTMSRLD